MIFVLSVAELMELDPQDPIWYKMLSRIDDARQAIFERRKKTASGRAIAIGAGLLLQYGFRLFFEEPENKQKDLLAETNIRTVSLKDCLEMEHPLSLAYEFEAEGKPKLVDASLTVKPYFNLSHAGEYVVLALSDRPVGIDIQDPRKQDVLQMAQRFYSEAEQRALLERLDLAQDLFYVLWCRKEAWGKCSGLGAVPALPRDFLDLQSGENAEYRWYETRIGSYFLCQCEAGDKDLSNC